MMLIVRLLCQLGGGNSAHPSHDMMGSGNGLRAGNTEALFPSPDLFPSLILLQSSGLLPGAVRF